MEEHPEAGWGKPGRPEGNVMASLKRVVDLITNPLDPEVPQATVLGILGERPSQSARSPHVWNPTLKALGWDTIYLPLDIPPGRLGQVVQALRGIPEYLGGNVAVPYKVEVMNHLDRLDETAQAIGAVNTIVRDPDGALIGFNTDGQGAVDALTRPQPGQTMPFVASLRGSRILLLGAGGAGQAVAYALVRNLVEGRLWIWNRTPERAVDLCNRLKAAGFRAETAGSGNLLPILTEVELVINATSVGQAGMQALPGGGFTSLEPFSPLAQVPVRIANGTSPEELRRWATAALGDIQINTLRSYEMVIQVPASVRFFDVVHTPLETLLLRQARLSGHPTLNGKAMNVCQGVAGFFLVMRRHISRAGMAEADLYQQVQAKMSEASARLG
jgi:shikimate dehydrogenase